MAIERVEESITVEQAVQARQAAERAVEEALARFHQLTGLRITELELTPIYSPITVHCKVKARVEL